MSIRTILDVVLEEQGLADQDVGLLPVIGEFSSNVDAPMNTVKLEQVSLPDHFGYDTLSLLSGGALNDLRRNAQRLENAKNGEMDKYFHCVGFCEASAKGGWSRFWARTFGEIREERQLRTAWTKARLKAAETLGVEKGRIKFSLVPSKAQEDYHASVDTAFDDLRADLHANKAGLDLGEQYASDSDQSETAEEFCGKACMDFAPKSAASAPDQVE